MDKPYHGVLVNAAGILYASLGFSLSVLTALFSLFHRGSKVQSATPHALPVLPRIRVPSNARRPPPLRSFSDQPPKSATTPSEKRRAPSSQRKEERMLASHRRSRSIPIITIDYFGSTDILGQISTEPHLRVPARKPLTFVITAPPMRSPPAATTNERPGFLSNFKPLFCKDRPKVERSRSSPQLCQQPSLPTLLFPKASNKDKILSVPSKSKPESKRRKALRRVPSAPDSVQEKLMVKVDPSFARNVEKKSLNLRTQPYEAPYFCNPPLPIPSQKPPANHNITTDSRDAAASNKTLDRKTPKSRKFTIGL